MNLDLPENYEKNSETFNSIRMLADQIEQAWNETEHSSMPQSCTLARQVMVCGMGGSSLAGRFVKHLFSQSLRSPLEICGGYSLPNYVGSGSLVIVCSYSGNTEETLSAAYEARQKNAQIYGITTGGKLKEFLERYNYPSYIFEPKFNPSGQPRFGVGYMIGATLSILSKCEFISFSEEMMHEAIKVVRRSLNDFTIDKDEYANLAKKTARELHGKAVSIIASEHLLGASYIFKNQLNETAKTMSYLYEIPELNHHLMEGLKNPALIKEHVKFFLVESELYNDRVKRRYPITKEVIDKNDIDWVVYKPLADTKIFQAFEFISFASFVSAYLSLLYGENPIEIPWVDFFKSALEKR